MANFEIDGVTFFKDNRAGHLRQHSKDNCFTLVKTDAMIEFYGHMASTTKPKEILEIGMFQGGSLVYFDKIFRPTTLIGVDITRTPIAPLEAYRENRPHVKTFYGRSQDASSTRGLAQSNFPRGIDLVVDDASHQFELTKRTFENIFPLVKPGGTYVIEDWAWSHRKQYQGPGAVWHDKPALSNLVINLVVMTAVSRVIESVFVTEHLISLTKGRGILPSSGLDVSDHLRGKELPLF